MVPTPAEYALKPLNIKPGAFFSLMQAIFVVFSVEFETGPGDELVTPPTAAVSTKVYLSA